MKADVVCCASRAELGRSTWRFLHTMMAQYPEEPTQNEQETLRSFVYLFARLYPWYVPPDTSRRT